MNQLTLFDYAALDAETRAFAQEQAREIKRLAQGTVQEIGRRLLAVKERLLHGCWGTWLAAEFGWSQDTANLMMNVARNLPEIPKFSEFAVSALYALAAPSTPEPARVEALERAATGESITHAAAREIIERHRDPAVEREERHKRRLDELHERAESAPSLHEDAARVINAEWLEGIARVPLGSVRLCFMDPPYNIGFDYGDGPEADLRPDAMYLDEMERCIIQAAARLTPDGSLWVLINDEYAAEFALALKNAGLTIRNWIKWYETFGVNCTGKFNRTSRHILYAVKDPSRLVFHHQTVRVPSARLAVYDDPRANPDGKVMDDVWIDIPRLAGTHIERIPTFPTQLPIALLSRIVAVASDPGDLILDPFSGSATTGVAALRLGRRYIGIEKQPHFAELSRKRLRAEGTAHANEPGP